MSYSTRSKDSATINKLRKHVELLRAELKPILEGQMSFEVSDVARMNRVMIETDPKRKRKKNEAKKRSHL